MSRLDLPDGQWAELASPRKVSDRKRRRFMSALSDSSAATADLPQVPNPNADKKGQPAMIPDPARMTGDQQDLQFHAFDLLVLCFVKSWSFEQGISLDAVEDLDADTKDALVKGCLPLMGDMMPDYSPDPDPKAHTVGSLSLPQPSSAGQPTSAILSSATI